MKGGFGCFLNEDERNSQYESHLASVCGEIQLKSIIGDTGEIFDR